MLHWLWQQNHRVNWPKRTWIFLKNSGKNKSVFSQMLSMTLLPLMTSWLCQVMSWFPREACEDVHNYFCLSYNNGQSKRPQVWQVIYFSNNTVLIFILLKNKNQKTTTDSWAVGGGVGLVSLVLGVISILEAYIRKLVGRGFFLFI